MNFKSSPTFFFKKVYSSNHQVRNNYNLVRNNHSHEVFGYAINVIVGNNI